MLPSREFCIAASLPRGCERAAVKPFHLAHHALGGETLSPAGATGGAHRRRALRIIQNAVQVSPESDRTMVVDAALLFQLQRWTERVGA